MKQFFIYASAFVLALTACNNEKKEGNSEATTETPAETTTETTSTPSTSATQSGLPENVDARVEELKQLKPLSLEQLKALLPPEVNGAKQSDFSGTANEAIAFASANYVKDGNNKVRLVIQDCANKGGSAIYKTQYAMVANAAFATESETSSFKAYDFMGGKATESHNKKGKKVDFNYIVEDRLLITLRTEGLTPEEVKQIAQNLKFDIQ